MILELPRRTEHFGAIRFHDVQRVYELDSGTRKFATRSREAVATISSQEIDKINEKMAIVIPIKDEKLKLLEGVLSGIPHDCQVIVVSGSQRSPVDRFMMEKQMIKQFNHFVDDEILLVHQQDPGLSESFNTVDFPSILGKDGIVRGGKAEAMFVGLLLTKMLGKEYVGFVDADNYVPGAVHEYVEIYAAGFILAESPYSMVRVSWVYKPKIVEDKLFFPKFGRVSEISSKHLNRLIDSYTGFGTDIIKTGNAGEHAMSMQLAELLPYASGYAVETYEIINVLEQFGGVLPCTNPQITANGIDIFQIETRNPHLHEVKGEEHIQDMLNTSLDAIYNSPICTEKVKTSILNYCKTMNESSPLNKIDPIIKLDFPRFRQIMEEKSQTLTRFN
jgi:mannosyl-3-phosphoglycerate synthase